tara:strand:- start:1157 stop:1336 length:180 start_codon:yes stop_codon:yes gene_type:complete
VGAKIKSVMEAAHTQLYAPEPKPEVPRMAGQAFEKKTSAKYKPTTGNEYRSVGDFRDFS